MMVIERYQARSKEKVAPGKHRIEVADDAHRTAPALTRRGCSQRGRQGSRHVRQSSAPCPPPSARARLSAWELTSVRRSRSTTSTAGRSGSKERSRVWRSSSSDRWAAQQTEIQIRNSKQIQNRKYKTNTRLQTRRIKFSVFDFLILNSFWPRFVSNFDIRISDFQSISAR